MDSTLEELEGNIILKDKFVAVDNIFTIINSEHQINVKLKEKCNKILSKYLNTVQEIEVVKKNFNDLQKRYNESAVNYIPLTKEYALLKEEHEQIQKSHYDFVNSSELKYQHACLRIDELEKEISVKKQVKTNEKVPKSLVNKLENELKEVKKNLEESLEQNEKLKDTRNVDLKQLATLKRENENLKNNKDGICLPKKIKGKAKNVILQIQTELNEKIRELDLTTLAHENDIETLKKNYEKQLKNLKEKLSTEKPENITIGIQTEWDEESETGDLNEILKEMTNLPLLVSPLSSINSITNETVEITDTVSRFSVATGPDLIIPQFIDASTSTENTDENVVKFKLKNKAAKVIKRRLIKRQDKIKKTYKNKSSRKQINMLKNLLNLNNECIENDSPFIVLPPNSKIKTLKDFVTSNTNLEDPYNKYPYPNYNSFATPFPPYNPYYLPYNVPMPCNNMFYPPNQNYCCSDMQHRKVNCQSCDGKFCCKNSNSLNNLNATSRNSNIEDDVSSNEDKGALFTQFKKKRNNMLKKNMNIAESNLNYRKKHVDEESCISSYSNNSKSSIYNIKNFLKVQTLNDDLHKELNDLFTPDKDFIQCNKIYLQDNMNKSEAMTQESLNKKRKSRIIFDSSDEDENCSNDREAGWDLEVRMSNEAEENKSSNNITTSDLSIISLTSNSLGSTVSNISGEIENLTVVEHLDHSSDKSNDVQSIILENDDRAVNSESLVSILGNNSKDQYNSRLPRRKSLESISSAGYSKIRTFSESAVNTVENSFNYNSKVNNNQSIEVEILKNNEVADYSGMKIVPINTTLIRKSKRLAQNRANKFTALGRRKYKVVRNNMHKQTNLPNAANLIVKKDSEKSYVFNENKWNMLGFDKEEISNDSDKRAALILHELISQYEKNLSSLADMKTENSLPVTSTPCKNYLHEAKTSQYNLRKSFPANENRTFNINSFNEFENNVQITTQLKNSCDKKRKRLTLKTNVNKRPKINIVNVENTAQDFLCASNSRTKIETPVNCDIVTFYKQKRRVAHALVSTTSNVRINKKTISQPLNCSDEQTVLNLSTNDTKQNSLMPEFERISEASTPCKPLVTNDISLKSNLGKASFKRPERSKFKIIPQTPKSPDVIEYVRESPKIIPLEKTTFWNFGKLKGNVTQLLKQGIEDNNKFSNRVEILSQRDTKVLSRVIVEVTITDISQDLDKTYTPPAPLLNKTQQRAILLINKLSNIHAEIPELVLQDIERRLMKEMRIVHVVTLTRLYVGIVMLHFNAEKLRMMCVNAAYCMGDLYVPFMFVALTMFPEILPTKEVLAERNPIEASIPKILIQIIKLKTCRKPGFNLLNLNMLLLQYYGYNMEKSTDDVLIQDLVKLYYETSSRIVYTAIILLCKNMPNEWTHTKIVKYFMPLVNKNLQNPGCEELVYMTIQLVTKLVQPFFYDIKDKQMLQSIRDWLLGFAEVNNTLPIAIRNTVSVSCMYLSKKLLYEESVKKQFVRRKKTPKKQKAMN